MLFRSRKKSESLSVAHADPNSYWKSEEFLSLVSERAQKSFEEGKHPFQHLSEESKERAKESSKRTRETPGSQWEKRIEYRRTPEGRAESSEMMKKSRAENPVFHTEEYKEKNLQHLTRVRQFLKRKMVSKGEKELAAVLHELDESFVLNEYKFYIGKYYPDIFSEKSKLIIEFNGDVAHSNPATYQPFAWNPIRKLLAHEVWKADAERKSFLESQGWTVHVVWQSEWKKSKQEVLDRIMRLVES